MSISVSVCVFVLGIVRLTQLNRVGVVKTQSIRRSS